MPSPCENCSGTIHDCKDCSYANGGKWPAQRGDPCDHCDYSYGCPDCRGCEDYHG